MQNFTIQIYFFNLTEAFSFTLDLLEIYAQNELFQKNTAYKSSFDKLEILFKSIPSSIKLIGFDGKPKLE